MIQTMEHQGQPEVFGYYNATVCPSCGERSIPPVVSKTVTAVMCQNPNCGRVVAVNLCSLDELHL